jgi:hypothetical protein
MLVEPKSPPAGLGVESVAPLKREGVADGAVVAGDTAAPVEAGLPNKVLAVVLPPAVDPLNNPLVEPAGADVVGVEANTGFAPPNKVPALGVVETAAVVGVACAVEVAGALVKIDDEPPGVDVFAPNRPPVLD